MARYVNRKYGIQIVSGDWFFLFSDQKSENNDWRACVYAHSYEHNEFTKYIPLIQTIPQSLMWEIDGDFNYRFNNYVASWVIKNIGALGKEWEFDRRVPMHSATGVLFRTRRNAEKFVKFLEETTRGVMQTETI